MVVRVVWCWMFSHKGIKVIQDFCATNVLNNFHIILKFDLHTVNEISNSEGEHPSFIFLALSEKVRALTPYDNCGVSVFGSWDWSSLKMFILMREQFLCFIETGKVTITDTWPNLQQAATARKRLKTALWHTRQPATSPQLNLQPPTQSGLALHSTSPYFTTRSWTLPKERASWPRQLLTMRLPSWTHWVRRATKIQLW